MQIALKSQYLQSKNDTFLKDKDTYIYMLAILTCTCKYLHLLKKYRFWFKDIVI